MAFWGKKLKTVFIGKLAQNECVHIYREGYYPRM